ncbi:MAG: alpha/beta-hydrolase family protein, partial [Rhodobacteraceae bacterium]|nr:alpha/beta-hydrolase family protein [Paracoccaceae bacterium]
YGRATPSLRLGPPANSVDSAGQLGCRASGISLVAGYAVGLFFASIWSRLQLPTLRQPLLTRVRGAIAVFCLIASLVTLWFASEWQNGLRLLLDMPPVETARPFSIAGGAAAVFLLLLWLARLTGWFVTRMSGRLAHLLPGPQALLVSILLTAVIFWNIGNGVFVRGALNAADRIYAGLDARFEERSPRPQDPLKTGAAGSLVDWETLGRMGRAMIASGPDQARIAALTGAEAMEPLRVYIGLNSAPDPEARADLALQELLRIDAFSRSTLVIATPTGTGWVDPAGQQALEYLLGGDVATVSVQYSYLASWIALLTAPEYGVETARAVFAAVYGHWRELPSDARPALYLNGLSLGSLNSDQSHDLHQVVGDPFNGALWVGPPFSSPTWLEVTRNRNPGSPAWLPSYRDGSAVRFMNQTGLRSDVTAEWGRFRILYLQHASDAVVFFDPRATWRRPAWMAGPRGPDVSPGFHWLPIVTVLQLGVDIMTAIKPPDGFGHSYDFASYARAWAMLLDLPEWTDARIQAVEARRAAPGQTSD